MRCPNCKCDDKTMLEIEFKDNRTKEFVVYCKCCSKVFRIEIEENKDV